MNRPFLEKVVRLGSLDTRNFRYIAVPAPAGYLVKRLALCLLNDPCPLSWEHVGIVRISGRGDSSFLM